MKMLELAEMAHHLIREKTHKNFSLRLETLYGLFAKGEKNRRDDL